MSSHESLRAVEPATPPRKKCTLKILCGFLSCRLVANLSKSTLDEPQKRYMKECRIYQQYMDDQEKQEQEEHKIFTERLRDLLNIRKRLRRRRDAVKPGGPPPRQPPCCPHWDKARPTACKAQKKGSNESLSVYEPGQMSRRERYEQRLRDPTSREARRKAACEARHGSITASSSGGRSDKPDAEMEVLQQRVRDIERRNAVLVEALGVKSARGRRRQPEEHRAENPAIKGLSSGGRSLGSIALKGNN